MKFNAFPVIRYLLFFITGILAYLQTHYFHTTFYLTFISLVLGLLASVYGKQAFVRGTLACLLFFFSGWIITYRSTAINNPAHFKNLGGIQYYQAVIISNAETKPRTFKAEAKIEAAQAGSKWKNTTGKVILYFSKDDSFKPTYGDVLLIKGTPKEVELPKNPEEFNYKQYLANKGIYASHFLKNKDYLLLGNKPPSALLKTAFQANLYADSVFKTWVQTPREYAIANAMIVGIRDDIDDDLLSAYSASGAIHVLSVSGMHVGILFWIIGIALGWLKKKGKHGPWIFLLITLSILWTYALFTGLSSTVLRATVTFSFLLVGTTLNRSHNIYNILAVSALVLLAWNPYWLADIGFQLSYLAIVGIVYLYSYLNELVNPTNPLIRIIWEGTVICFAAQLFTTPLSIYYFHQFPAYFLIANPVVAFFSFSILPAGLFLLFFASVPILSHVLAFILKYSCLLLNESVFAFQKLPLSTLKGFSISMPELLAWYAILGLSIAFFRYSELKYLRIATGLFSILALANVYEDYKQSSQKELTFHAINNHAGVSLIEGKSATFMGDSGVIHDKKIYNFNLKNYYDRMGVSNQNLLDVASYTNHQGMTVFEFDGRKILWLQKPFKGNLIGRTNYVLLSNNAIRDLRAFESLKPDLIIVDGSYKPYLVENLKKQAGNMGLPLVVLNQTGAYSVRPN
ncbi:ComEC/Rec2 family competence protein [Emticicia sp. 21SJ11W-3]|uniref:ComEC/Rec2 family competence protein n=1 Tax=Emticicia sp. 21SJ11W-3 TaxID=2916755 RepID=UPI00209EE520|nr:ComEC/Rec2 family competence protein [Emticicia sp. 21SJ11W-3]UTA68279.1 ComEC/Rec2 family competence protein [Emticicia sp. 21SJ11W-3]